MNLTKMDTGMWECYANGQFSNEENITVHGKAFKRYLRYLPLYHDK